MPALPPPSMTIGAPAPGYAPIAVSGPSRTPNSTPGLPVLVQSSQFFTNVSGPTNIVQPVTATKQGTYLVWVVTVVGSAATALGGTPTGWTLLASQTTATLALGVYGYPNNPGGITSVTFSSNATATTGGIASQVWEVDNAFTATAAVRSANGSSTAVASGSLTAPSDNNLLLGAMGWVLGTATLTNTSTNSSGLPWQNLVGVQSGSGTTNASLNTLNSLGAFGAGAAAQVQGTLTVSSVWAAAIIALPSTASSQAFFSGTRANVVDNGGVSVGDAGNAGWSLGPGRAGFSGGIGSQ